MSKDLEEYHVPIAPSTLKSSFISDIIKDLNRNKLDNIWKPLLIHDFIKPARSYLRLQQNLRTHHTTYKTQTSHDSNNDSNENKKNQPKNDDKIAKDKDRKHHIVEAIKNRTFKVENFTKEVGANKCVFQGTILPGTKSSSLESSKLKELMAGFPQPSTDNTSKPPRTPAKPPPSPTAPPQARQATVPQQSPPVTATAQPTDDQEQCNALKNLTELGDNLNNSNDPLIPYLTLAANSVVLQSKHNISHTTVVHSGAFPMMFQLSHYFTELHPWTNTTHTHATFADGTSQAPIQGIGTNTIEN